MVPGIWDDGTCSGCAADFWGGLAAATARVNAKGDAMPETLRAIGLMSGTSMDGIDVALVETDGETRTQAVAHHAISYPSATQDTLRAAMEVASRVTDRSARPEPMAAAESLVTEAHAQAVLAFLDRESIAADSVDVIGFHGQTVFHKPNAGLTIQLGDGAALARATGIDVVYDFRAADMKAGGEGAPLAPVYHQALAHAVPGWPVAFLNLGGVGNVTWIGRDGSLLAFDTGPGNALIDDFVRANSNARQDEGGAFASRGRVDETALHTLVMHPYFAAPPPKSLDRNAFDAAPVAGLSLDD